MSDAALKQTILSIDTAMGGVGVGVMAANGHIVSRMEETARAQAALLVPMVQETLEEAQISFQDLDLIAMTTGPGSFTGLRIGLATARSFGLALDIPVVGVGTLDVMARHYNTPCSQPGGLNEKHKSLLIVLETKRQDFYARYYGADGTPLSEPIAADAQTILEQAPADHVVVGGDCLERFQSCTSADLDYQESWSQADPILVATCGLENFLTYGDQGTPQPLYLRGADVSQPKHLPRKLEGFS